MFNFFYLFCLSYCTMPHIILPPCADDSISCHIVPCLLLGFAHFSCKIWSEQSSMCIQLATRVCHSPAQIFTWVWKNHRVCPSIANTSMRKNPWVWPSPANLCIRAWMGSRMMVYGMFGWTRGGGGIVKRCNNRLQKKRLMSCSHSSLKSGWWRIPWKQHNPLNQLSYLRARELLAPGRLLPRTEHI